MTDSQHSQSLPQPSPHTLLQRLILAVLTKRNLLVFGAFVLGCTLTGYFFARKEAPPENVPLIRAKTTPYKIRPENDEQPQIPHEDKLVYNRLAPSAAQPRVERLLPKPEQPIFLEPEVKTVQKTQSFGTEEKFPLDSKHSPNLAPPLQETFPLLPAKPAKKPTQSSPNAKVSHVSIIPGHRPAVPSKPVVQKVMVPTRPAAKPQRQKVMPAQKARYRVQLAAMRTPTLARQEWHRLATINPELKRLTPRFVRTDLGARKGIFYRVQGGRFVTQQQAQRLCRQLKRKTPQLPCMVVSID
ncbi:MAG: SPOR domain-containing protein [Pseudomonadota bacterium]